MKRSILIASAAMMALAASAQYNVDPATSLVVDKGVSTVDFILLSEGAIADFTKAGAKVTDLGPNEEDRNFWIWESTYGAGDSSNPRVDMEEGGYVALEILSVGWSGAGFNIGAPGANLAHFTDETRFHCSYMSPTNNAPASVALVILDGGDFGSKPAKVALGTAFNDNNVIYPAVGAKMTDEWQAIDISLGDLRKIWNDFNLANTAAWQGNILSILGGGVTGQTLAFDATYFYNLGGSGVNEFGADVEGFVVTDKTVNALNGNGIELYALDGKLVKSANGSTLGLDGLNNGVYVVRCGSKTQKIVVR